MNNRFKVKDESLYIDDEYFCELVDGVEITRLLNTQQLKVEELLTFEDEIKKFIKENKDLKQENMQLKLVCEEQVKFIESKGLDVMELIDFARNE